MIDHVIGELLIYLAFAFNIVAGVAYLAVARGAIRWESLAKRAYAVFVLCVSLAVVWLFYLFFSHNFAFKYVYGYSDRSLPFGFLLASFWGGQEGTYLLWLFFNAIFGFLLIRCGRQYRDYAMVVMASINLFFLFILTQLSPFALLGGIPPDGAGLNPLLQDFWMVIHPPVMFVGYSIVAIPFSIAMAALIRNDYKNWLRCALPWVGIAALALGAGNIMGGYWAYKTLGWGGYWAWDPVENSSFVPWFVALALIHGMVVERRSGALRKTNILMTAYLFLLVVYGTFLTRSGVLADFSVHSFVDLGTTGYLVAFLGFFVAMTLVFFIPRIRSLGHTPMSLNFFGREFSLVVSIWLLLGFALIVMFWMSLPLLTQLVGAQPRAADIATYNSFALPFAILYALLLTVAPFTVFGDYKPKRWIGQLVTFSAIGAVIGLVPVFFFGADGMFALLTIVVFATIGMYTTKPDLMKKLIPSLVGFAAIMVIARLLGVTSYLYLLFLGVGTMVFVSNVSCFFGYLPGRWKQSGAQLAHLGFGVMILGVLASSVYVTNEKLVLDKGETKSAFGFLVTYQGMEHSIEHPHNQLILALGDSSDSEYIYPELYYSRRLDGIMRKPSIRKNGLYDLYFAPEQIIADNGPQGLKLVRGDTTRVEQMQFVFDDFIMGDHGEMNSGGMRVAAQIFVLYEDHTDTLLPAVEFVSQPGGGSKEVQHPASLNDGAYHVHLIQIMADERAIVLDIPGLVDNESSERLVLDISRKMLIDLVWAGCILILAGVFVAFIRRKAEMPENL